MRTVSIHPPQILPTTTTQVLKTFSPIFQTSSGHTPALACAPNRDVADCLALILNSMMHTSPMVTIAAIPALSLAQTVIHHHSTSNHISKGVAFDTPPSLRPDHASYCRPERPLSSVSGDDELNDSDSETYWGLLETASQYWQASQPLRSLNR